MEPDAVPDYSDSPLSDAAICPAEHGGRKRGKNGSTRRERGQISHSETQKDGCMLQLNRRSSGSRGRNVTLRGPNLSYSDTDSKALSTNNVRLYQQKDRFGNDSTYQANRFNVTPTKQYSYCRADHVQRTALACRLPAAELSVHKYAYSKSDRATYDFSNLGDDFFSVGLAAPPLPWMGRLISTDWTRPSTRNTRTVR